MKLYILIDKNDPFEFPKFVGTRKEMAEHLHKRDDYVDQVILSTKRRNGKCKYIKIDIPDDDEEEL